MGLPGRCLYVALLKGYCSCVSSTNTSAVPPARKSSTRSITVSKSIVIVFGLVNDLQPCVVRGTGMGGRENGSCFEGGSCRSRDATVQMGFIAREKFEE